MLAQTRAAPSRAAQRSAPPSWCGGVCLGTYPWAPPRSGQTTSKAKPGSGCHRALLRHRCAPATSPLGTEMHPLPNHPWRPCSSGTTPLWPGQCSLTVVNSLDMFPQGQAQQLCECVAYQISGRVAFLHPFPSTDLEGVGQAAVQAPRSGQDASAKPALHICKDK